MALHQRLPVSAQDIRNGFALVELPGRFQVLPGQPTVVLDVAHNPHAAATLAQGLDKMGYHPYTYAIFGAMADKDIEGVIKPLLDIVDFWFCTDLPTPRAASAQTLAEKLETMGVRPKNGADGGIESFPEPALAYQKALSQAGEGDRIITFGSFYTVAGVMTYRNNQAH
jgi:dihydrofolate synthase/folylpolyglutamate synthase